MTQLWESPSLSFFRKTKSQVVSPPLISYETPSANFAIEKKTKSCSRNPYDTLVSTRSQNIFKSLSSRPIDIELKKTSLAQRDGQKKSSRPTARSNKKSFPSPWNFVLDLIYMIFVVLPYLTLYWREHRLLNTGVTVVILCVSGFFLGCMCVSIECGTFFNYRVFYSLITTPTPRNNHF